MSGKTKMRVGDWTLLLSAMVRHLDPERPEYAGIRVDGRRWIATTGKELLAITVDAPPQEGILAQRQAEIILNILRALGDNERAAELSVAECSLDVIGACGPVGPPMNVALNWLRDDSLVLPSVPEVNRILGIAQKLSGTAPAPGGVFCVSGARYRRALTTVEKFAIPTGEDGAVVTRLGPTVIDPMTLRPATLSPKLPWVTDVTMVLMPMSM